MNQLEEMEGERHRLDDDLVGLVVPVSGDELHIHEVGDWLGSSPIS
jgi:hypothetical protein